MKQKAVHITIIQAEITHDHNHRTHSVFAGYGLDHRRYDHAGSGSYGVHNAVQKTRVVWREVLIVRQVGDASGAVEAQRQEEKDVGQCERAANVADNDQTDAREKVS